MSENTSTVEVQDDLRAWAKGMHTFEAATELLIRGMGGRFALPTILGSNTKLASAVP
ncbi:hypothetical protein [Nakamurella panacisegetis]|uniref:hypothetical protein n=1 Tax=Nakamurella panacisegetis TaxID=1090615 RepID=UPI000B02FC21|nr:hypothetical protein [Nakamurella panacisegetis]